VLVLADHAEQYQYFDNDPMVDTIINVLGYNNKNDFINDYDNNGYDDISEDTLYKLNNYITNNDMNTTPSELLSSIRNKIDKELPDGTIVFNPGSFSCDYSFVVYYPAKRTIDNCTI